MRKLLIFPWILLCQSIIAQIPASHYAELHYRLIGPFRAGRTVGAVGVATQPNVFYIGVNNGGVWKTDDYGRTWKPIFDSAPTGSVGDIAVSPSNPDIIYVGSGEGLHRPDLSVGDGMFKSTDGGRSWTHIGLDDVQQIGRVIVHPSNPDIVYAAGLGHPYGANDMRGVYRTMDGGKTWEKLLYINHNTGAIQVEFDPSNPDILYADMWEHREGPWENAAFTGTNSGLYKSTDKGKTWRKLTNGLPTGQQGLGRIGIGISPGQPQRLYATVDAREQSGIYRSDDGGEHWKRISTDGRVFGRGSDFAELKVHPNNPDLVYSANVAAYKSTDGGYTWTAFKGAPGGDDYHRIWINPLHPEIMLFAADQGAVITVNGGQTWSSWYNQPTAQLYHVSTDNQFPYRVYGGQQESGAIAIDSRGNGGQITFRNWQGVGADEYAYVAPDPKNPEIIYGGRVIRYNMKTGQSQNVAPEILRSGAYRFLRTMPLVFHPADPDALLFATNVLWKTTNGGQQWEIISPDLTRKQPEVPASIGDFRNEGLKTMPQRAIIYALAPSPLDKNIIWAGTDDGLVHLTRDGGKTWKDVTPAALTSWDKISIIDAGHFDPNTAYIAVNAIRKDDMVPHIYRTHDGGASWQEINAGMHRMGPVNVVREDPKQPGLLYAGTEREVYFSTDDGAHWQSLRMNMPATSIRDLVIHDDDLVVGTHGRSIWILDNISPLRELTRMQAGGPYLFKPVTAYRVRYNMFYDTPLPPEEPAGQNPPEGAILDYFLPSATGEVVLEILDAQKNLVRKFTSSDKPLGIDPPSVPYPTHWMWPVQILSREPGHHRFTWDLRYPVPPGSETSLSIAAVTGHTALEPRGPFVRPGTYTVRLSVAGRVQEKALELRMDPRVSATSEDIRLQWEYSMRCYRAYEALQAARDSIDLLLNDRTRTWKTGAREQMQSLRGSGAPGYGDILYGSIRETSPDKETIVGLQDKMLYLLSVLQSADAHPTTQAMHAVERLEAMQKQVLDRWAQSR
ncbi:MAG: hypothetical protein MUE58_02670 [Chitinophagaceae bacterium]|nr:hypothetical protein [Chitinophagaceae bacterium]